MRILPVVLLLMFIAACRPATPLATVVTPTTPALTGKVTILTPPEGALIYSEVIHLSGTAANIPGNEFELTLTGPDALQIATSRVRLTGDSWQIELPHTYTGEPIEVTVAARPLDSTINAAYDLVTIAIAGLDYRPPGTFGAITFPQDGSSAGGDQIPVEGTASGLADKRLSLTLLAADGAPIDTQTITIDNPYIIDDMPWSAEIDTHGYTGKATLQISSQQIIDEISLTIESTAG